MHTAECFCVGQVDLAAEEIGRLNQLWPAETATEINWTWAYPSFKCKRGDIRADLDFLNRLCESLLAFTAEEIGRLNQLWQPETTTDELDRGLRPPFQVLKR